MLLIYIFECLMLSGGLLIVYSVINDIVKGL